MYEDVRGRKGRVSTESQLYERQSRMSSEARRKGRRMRQQGNGRGIGETRYHGIEVLHVMSSKGLNLLILI